MEAIDVEKSEIKNYLAIHFFTLISSSHLRTKNLEKQVIRALSQHPEK